MWFPDKKLVISPAKFNVNALALWKDKDGNKHECQIETVTFKSLNVGYIYGIILSEPYNGVTKMLAKESNLSCRPRLENEEKPIAEKKTRKPRKSKKATEVAETKEVAE